MTLTIGKRLAAGFGMAIVVLTGLAAYNLIETRELANLQDEGAGRAEDAVRLTEIWGMGPRMHQIVADSIINRDLNAALKDWNGLKVEMERGRAYVALAADTPQKVEWNKLADTAYQALVATFEKKLIPLLRKSEGVTQEIRDLDKKLAKQIATMGGHYRSIVESLQKEMAEANEVYDHISTKTETVSAIVAAVSIIVLSLIAPLTARGIVKPVTAMTEAMRRLAKGDHEVEIPTAEHKDEIGDLARMVQMFKDDAIRVKKMEAERIDAEERAKAGHTTAMGRLATDFESHVGNIADTVSAASEQMHSSAQSLSRAADQANVKATVVAAAAEQASTNVQTVAAAADELSASIAEISRQVTQSTDISKAAVQEVEATDVKVQGLADAAQKIGEVVELITDIAEQTNLLALNATIEAARAGDAGKGFAVVASEVKNLANQTAKATEEIGAQIGGIQTATQDAVEAIRSIGTTISQVNEIAATIAAAVEEQGAATSEIARNIEQAAAGTQEVSANISGVTQAAGETGQAAKQVLNAATSLSQESKELHNEVVAFVNEVRTA